MEEESAGQEFDLLDFLCQDQREQGGLDYDQDDQGQLPLLTDDLLREVVNSLGVEEDTNTSSSLGNDSPWSEVNSEGAKTADEEQANW